MPLARLDQEFRFAVIPVHRHVRNIPAVNPTRVAAETCGPVATAARAGIIAFHLVVAQKAAVIMRIGRRQHGIKIARIRAVPEIIDGKIQGYIGTITDITERKIIENKIKESEEKYRTIIEAFPDIPNILLEHLEITKGDK